MNLFLQTFVLTGLPFGIIIGIFQAFYYNLRIGVIAGIISGPLLGLFMALVAEFQASKFQKERPLLAGESLIKEGPANHFYNKEGVGGWIYLTDKRLFFKSHSVNIQTHELSIPLAEIMKSERGKTLGLIPNQLKLQLKNETVEKFVVNGVKDWIAKIEELK